MRVSRREFLESSAAVAAAAAAAGAEGGKVVKDGPATRSFSPVPLRGNAAFAELAGAGLSERMTETLAKAPAGASVSWGIPFEIGRPILLKDAAVTERVAPFKAEWLVFLHTSDEKPLESDASGFIRPMRGEGYLGEHVADYVIVYADSTEVKQEIRRRHHLGTFQRRWGENCFQAVPHSKPHPIKPLHEQRSMLIDSGGGMSWGRAETRVSGADQAPWMN